MNRLPVAALVKFLSLAVVVVLATTVLAVTIANASSGDRATYTARFTDAAGLLVADDVRIAGVVVGSVDEVRIVDRRVAEVRFSVDRAQQLPASVSAEINYKNLIGQRYLALEQGDGTGVLAPGGTIPEDRTRGPLNLTLLFNGFQPLFTALDAEQVNQLSFEVIEVLQGQGGTVESLLASTASLTTTIADRDEVIGQVIDNLNAVLDTVNDRDEELSDLIVSLQQLVSGLAEDREPIGNALTSIGELTQVTAGLVQDARPALRDDVVALGDLSDNLVASEGTIESFLQNWGPKLRKLNRAASYGSWFNFYLCGIGGQLGASPFIEPVQLDLYANEAARCGADPDAGAGPPTGSAPRPAAPPDEQPADEPDARRASATADGAAVPDEFAGLPLLGEILGGESSGGDR